MDIAAGSTRHLQEPGDDILTTCLLLGAARIPMEVLVLPFMPTRTCLISVLIQPPQQEGRLLFVSYIGALCVQSGYNIVQDRINQLLEPSEKRVKNKPPPTTLPSPLPQQVSPPSDASAASQAHFMNQLNPNTPTYSQPSPRVTQPPPYIPETPGVFSNPNGLFPFRQAGSTFKKQRPPPTTKLRSIPPTNARLAGFVLAFGPPMEAHIVDGLTRPPRSLQLLRTSCGIVVLVAPFASPRSLVSRQTSPLPSPPYSPSPLRNPFLAVVQLLQVDVARWILSLLSSSLGPEWVHGSGFVSIILSVLIQYIHHLSTHSLSSGLGCHA